MHSPISAIPRNAIKNPEISNDQGAFIVCVAVFTIFLTLIGIIV